MMPPSSDGKTTADLEFTLVRYLDADRGSRWTYADFAVAIHERSWWERFTTAPGQGSTVQARVPLAPQASLQGGTPEGGRSA